MTDNIFDSSGVYTEDELVDIISHPYRMVEELVSIEQQLSAVMTWQYIIDNELYHYVADTQLEALYNTAYAVEAMPKTLSNMFKATTNWILKIKQSLTPANKKAFMKSVIRITNNVTVLEEKIKQKTVKDDYIKERIDKLVAIRPDVLQSENYMVTYIDYDTQMSRFEGLSNICKRISDMANANDVESFASDKIWDELANSSNGVAKGEEPDKGTTFRQFSWLQAREKEFDLKNSKWMERSNLEAMTKHMIKTKNELYTELLDAAEHIKKTCGHLKAEAQHVRYDDLQDVSVSYARSFLVTKLIASIQGIVLKEINYFCVSGIKKLTTQEKYTTKDGEKEKPEGDKRNVIV